MALPVSSRLLTGALLLVTVLGGAIPARAQSEPGDLPPLRVGRLTFSGSMHADASRTEDEALGTSIDQMAIHRARVGMVANATSRVVFNVSAEMTSTPRLRNAFVQVGLSNAVNIRAGQANPLSTIERGSGPTVLEFIDRTRLTQRLSYAQDIGISVFNDKPLGGWLSYAVSVIDGAGFDRWDNNRAKDVVGRVEYVVPHHPHISIVTSGGAGRQPDGNRTRASVGAEFDSGTIKFTGEALREHTGQLAVRDGFYVSGVYRIRPAHERPHFRMAELVGRFFTMTDPLSPSLPPTTREIQAGGNYYVNRNFRLMLDGIVPVDRRVTSGPTLAMRFQALF